jgi:hypothetical protein
MNSTFQIGPPLPCPLGDLTPVQSGQAHIGHQQLDPPTGLRNARCPVWLMSHRVIHKSFRSDIASSIVSPTVRRIRAATFWIN